MCGKVDIVKDLLKRSSKSVGRKTKSPLHFAAWYGQLEAYKVISENMKDKNPKDKYGITPLHTAAYRGHFELCQYIISNIEDKNPMDNYKITPLHGATKEGHLNIFHLLFKHIKIEDKTMTSCNRQSFLTLATKTRRVHNQSSTFVMCLLRLL